jgi:hypothetical protein
MKGKNDQKATHSGKSQWPDSSSGGLSLCLVAMNACQSASSSSLPDWPLTLPGRADQNRHNLWAHPIRFMKSFEATVRQLGSRHWATHCMLLLQVSGGHANIDLVQALRLRIPVHAPSVCHSAQAVLKLSWRVFCWLTMAGIWV